ncbi:MAG TPA: bifunctional precorrin-2 dehydrogenase/sirohydrochlorin ferrochelatase [Gaiellaceae bacterium]
MPDRHYVACLGLERRRCLVVGEGATAREKVKGLADCGAEVATVAPAEYDASDLDGVWLAVAATADEDVNTRVFTDAAERRIFCNVADVPELCSFILPAIHRRGDLTVAVSTNGASPALAQWLRDRFAAQIGFEHEQLARELRRLRPWAKQTLHSYEPCTATRSGATTSAISLHGPSDDGLACRRRPGRPGADHRPRPGARARV